MQCASSLSSSNKEKSLPSVNSSKVSAGKAQETLSGSSASWAQPRLIPASEFPELSPRQRSSWTLAGSTLFSLTLTQHGPPLARNDLQPSRRFYKTKLAGNVGIVLGAVSLRTWFGLA